MKTQEMVQKLTDTGIYACITIFILAGYGAGWLVFAKEEPNKVLLEQNTALNTLHNTCSAEVKALHKKYDTKKIELEELDNE